MNFTQSAVALALTALTLSACGPEEDNKPEPQVITPTSALATAKEFASGVYTATSGLQNLVNGNVLTNIDSDFNTAADVYEIAVEEAFFAMTVAAAAATDISMQAFTDWDGTLDNGPTGYKFDYSSLPASINLVTNTNNTYSLNLFNDLIDDEMAYWGNGLTLTSGELTWDNANQRMAVSLVVTNADSVATSFSAAIVLPASTSGSQFTLRLEDASVSNANVLVAFEDSIALSATINMFESIELSPATLAEVTMTNNPYLSFKSMTVESSKLNIDVTGGVRPVHFDGVGSATIVRTAATNSYGGYLALPTSVEFEGNFSFGDLEASGGFDFAMTGVDEVYLVDERLKKGLFDQKTAGFYDDAANFVTTSYDSGTKTLTVETTAELSRLDTDYLWDSDTGTSTYVDVTKRVVSKATSLDDANVIEITTVDYDVSDTVISTGTNIFTDNLESAIQIRSNDNSGRYSMSYSQFNDYDYNTDTVSWPFNTYELDITEMLTQATGNVYACGYDYNAITDSFNYPGTYDCSVAGTVDNTVGTFSITEEVATITFTDNSEYTIKVDNWGNWVIEDSTGYETGWLSIEAMSKATIRIWFYGDTLSTITENINGVDYTANLSIDGEVEVTDEAATDGAIDSSMWGPWVQVSTDVDDYVDFEFADLSGVGVSLTFHASVQASASSPLLGISADISASNLNEAVDWLDSPEGALTAFALTYESTTYLVGLDFDTEAFTLSNEAGDIVLSIVDSGTDTIGSITVDGVKQADIRETATEIQAIFTDGAIQILATEM